MTSRRSLAGLATVALVAGVTGAGALVDTTVRAQPALAIDESKGHPGFCRDNVGVTVVVDFQALGGETIVRCNPQAERGTGLDALKGAGFQVAGVQRWGESFICRIENRPSAVEEIAIEGNSGYREQCIDTPPAAGYWSYWHAGNNCAWTYSQWGVKNRDFIQGGFEGWSFSLNATADSNPEPRISSVRPGTEGEVCDAPYEPPPTSNDPNERQPTRDGAGGGGTSGGGNGGTGGGGTGGSGGAGDRDGADGGESTDGDPLPAPRPRDVTADPGVKVPEAERAADPAENVSYTGGEDLPDVRDVLREQSGASPIARIAAVTAVVALLAGGFVIARRRRQVREA